MNKKIISDDGCRQIIDVDLRDYWNGKVYVTIFLDKFDGCIAPNKEYKKEINYLKKHNLSHIIPQKYLEVINFKPDQIKLMQKYFDIPEYYTKEKWVIYE